MRNALRKAVLPTTILIFTALIAANAYVASKHFKLLQKYAAQRTGASDARSAIAALEIDLQAIETGQRGYLLTGDTSYLSPYTQAVQQLPSHFSELRSRLSGSSPEERSTASELEQVAAAKVADADETIRLREKGYRHRAFLIVDSNRGKQLMDRAQSLLAQLSEVQTRNIAAYDRQLADGVTQALSEAALAAVILLALTVITLLAFHSYGKRLERAHSKQDAAFRAATERLERFTSTLSDVVRTTVTEMRDQSESLLNVHGGFLPRQGQEIAEWLHEASSYLHRVLENLLVQPAPRNTPVHVATEGEHDVGIGANPAA